MTQKGVAIHYWKKPDGFNPNKRLEMAAYHELIETPKEAMERAEMLAVRGIRILSPGRHDAWRCVWYPPHTFESIIIFGFSKAAMKKAVSQ